MLIIIPEGRHYWRKWELCQLETHLGKLLSHEIVNSHYMAIYIYRGGPPRNMENDSRLNSLLQPYRLKMDIIPTRVY